jgi:DNA processing protein
VTDLRISKQDLQTLIPKVAEEYLEDTFCRSAWSVICEPGDGFAGFLISKMGATAALEAEIQGISTKQLKSKLISLGFDSVELDTFGVFEKSHAEARERWRPRLQLEMIRTALFKINKVGGFVMTPEDPNWPQQLQDLGQHAPFALWVRGSGSALRQLDQSISIVGSRGATSYGEFATDSMVSALVPKGYSIVSGGAYGIDGIAHRSTLALRGNTVAVMAGGLDKFYPSGNSDLLKRISQTGAVISEVPPGTTPSKWRFLQRNRLISALGQSTLVIEANWRSGALNTVSHSERLERPVYAVPGPITSPKSAGTNKLIAENRAQLVVDGNDLLEQLGETIRVTSKLELDGLGALEKRVLDAIGFDVLEIAEICSSAGLTRDEARFGLSCLELDGLVLRRDNTWSKSQTTV